MAIKQLPVPRDYEEEMAAFLASRIPTGDFVLAVLSGNLVAELRRDDADLLDGWLQERAALIIADYLRKQFQLQRLRAGRESKRSAFAKEAAEAEEEGPEAVSAFAQRYYVDETKNTWRTVGDMTGPDHMFVSRDYDDRSDAMKLLAKFHQAVGERIGLKRTADVMTEAQYVRLRDSIVKP